ncbi:hypothetical protein T03_12562 [Trichinella britovi]|uniref:Uncharacterized protein n=1 Tax=Trichinella britovi TaxID=45882 RepID=A0A0V1CKZ0_TRIBR|nr:hypothetical protein T03_5448 [Trichinella britovi]KRY50129.1 hypothetical protein T03_12562 [Trichinella britovi]
MGTLSQLVKDIDFSFKLYSFQVLNYPLSVECPFVQLEDISRLNIFFFITLVSEADEFTEINKEPYWRRMLDYGI